MLETTAPGSGSAARAGLLRGGGENFLSTNAVGREWVCLTQNKHISGRAQTGALEKGEGPHQA